MDDAPVTTSPAPPRRPIWQRPVSRRAVLATGATGAAAAALAVLWKGNDLAQILDHVRDLTHGYQGALSSERVRVAHLLRRARSGLDKAGPAQLFTQNQLFRGMALGNFDDLLKAVSKDPAMMVYLDTETNRKGKPNENYARELMELFTTGIGHYTEDDVRESARSFTGWTLQGGKQLRYASASQLVPRLHDAGVKTFMGKTGTFTGDDIVEMLVPLRATAVRLSTRLFSFFAYPNPEPEIVNHLADTFQKAHYNVGAVLREIFTIDAFYSDKAYRSLVKTPAELVAQTLKATGANAKTYTAAAVAMAPMGQV